MKIKVFRFSNFAWEPQLQSHHLFLAQEDNKKNIIADIEKYAQGVWVFLNIKKKNFYSRHLKEAEYMPYCELTISDKCMAFDGAGIFEETAWKSVKELLDLGVETAYLPYFVYQKYLEKQI